MAGRKVRVCIDAGHYGKYNRSPVVPDYYESDMVWKLHLMQKEILERYGFDVVLTRGSQAADRGLYDRGYAAKGCDLFLSIHSNACSSEGVDYPVVYRGYDNVGNCDELALKLAKAVAATMGTTQAGRTAIRRGSSGGEYYGVLRGARAAGLKHYYIIEHSFHTNAKATRWLQSDVNLKKLAEAECRVIAEYYGMGGNQEENRDGGKQEESASPKPGAGQTGVIPYLITTACDALNIRSGPGMEYHVVGVIREPAGKKNRYTIMEEKSGWGRLKSGAGWISLSKTRKVQEAGGQQPGSAGSEPGAGQTGAVPYLVTIACDMLNIRAGAGTVYSVVGTISEKAGEKKQYTIVEEKDGWGRLKSGAGWIKLSYTERAS